MLNLVGDIDLCTAARLDDALDEMLSRHGVRQVIVNLSHLSHLSFCGLAALNSLLRAQQRGRHRNVALYLVDGPRWRWLIGQLGCSDLFYTFPKLSSAIVAATLPAGADPLTTERGVLISGRVE